MESHLFQGVGCGELGLSGGLLPAHNWSFSPDSILTPSKDSWGAAGPRQRCIIQIMAAPLVHLPAKISSMTLIQR